MVEWQGMRLQKWFKLFFHCNICHRDFSFLAVPC